MCWAHTQYSPYRTLLSLLLCWLQPRGITPSPTVWMAPLQEMPHLRQCQALTLVGRGSAYHTMQLGVHNTHSDTATIPHLGSDRCMLYLVTSLLPSVAHLLPLPPSPSFCSTPPTAPTLSSLPSLLLTTTPCPPPTTVPPLLPSQGTSPVRGVSLL